MKFLVGSQNFGLDVPDSDKDYMQFYFPSLIDLCKPIPRPEEVREEDNSITKRVDIRYLPELFYKSNLDILQLLYAKEKEESVLSGYFNKFKEELGTINLPRVYQSIMGSALTRYKTGTTKDLAHNIFGFKTLIKFEENGFTNLQECFEHGDREFYRSIRTGEYESGLVIAQELEEIAKSTKESYTEQPPNDEFMGKLQYAIGDMVVNRIVDEKLFSL